MQEKLAWFEEETATLNLHCVQQAPELEKKKQRCLEQQEELEEERWAKKELMRRLEQTKEAARRMWEEMELERLRAITAKWEERESRWVQRLQELESMSDKSGWAASSSRASPIDMPTAKEDIGAGYVASTSNGGGGCEVHGRRVDFGNGKAESGCYAVPVGGITDNLTADRSNTRPQTAGQGSIVCHVITPITSTSLGDRLP